MPRLLDLIKSKLKSQTSTVKNGRTILLKKSKHYPEWADERRKAYDFAATSLSVDGELDINLVEEYCIAHRYTNQKNQLNWIKRIIDSLTLEESESYNWHPFASFVRLKRFVHQINDDNITWFRMQRDSREFSSKEAASFVPRQQLVDAAIAWLSKPGTQRLLYDLDSLDGTTRGDQVLRNRRIALLICLNLLNGPCRRLEYFNLQCRKSNEDIKQNYFIDSDESFGTNAPRIVLEHYKTSDDYGTFVKNLTDYMTIYLLRAIPRSQTWQDESSLEGEIHHYFDSRHKTRQLMTAFRTILKGRFKEPLPNISCDLLRKIDVRFYLEIGALRLPEGRRWLADQHGNNPRTQLLYYFKNDPLAFKDFDSDDIPPPDANLEEEDSDVEINLAVDDIDSEVDDNAAVEEVNPDNLEEDHDSFSDAEVDDNAAVEEAHPNLEEDHDSFSDAEADDNAAVEEAHPNLELSEDASEDSDDSTRTFDFQPPKRVRYNDASVASATAPVEFYASRKDKAIAALKYLGPVWNGVYNKWPKIFALQDSFGGEAIGPLIRSLVPEPLKAPNPYKKFQERTDRYESWNGDKAKIRIERLQQARDTVFHNKRLTKNLNNQPDVEGEDDLIK